VAEHDSVIPAGGSGTLTAIIKTAATQNGRLSKSIGVVTDAGDARNFRLRFTADVRAPIVAKPSFRLSLTAIRGSASSTRVLLHRVDGKALEIGEVTLDHPDLVVRARPVIETTEARPAASEPADLWSEMASRRKSIEAKVGDVWIELAAKPSAAPGRTSGKLRFTTNDPDAPEVSLPYWVRVRPLIEVRPEGVRMWLSSGRGEGGRSSIVILRQTKGGEFAVTDVEVSHPEIFTAAANSTATASRQAVRVRLADGLDRDGIAGSVEGWIEVHTDDAEQPVVEIPVIVAPTRSLATRLPLPTGRTSKGLTTLEP
jgi:hypothetical protein